MTIKRRPLKREDDNLPVELTVGPKQIALLHDPAFQPIKTADERHHAMIVLNKNFLPLLLNPTDDKTLVSRKALTPKGTILVQAIQRKEEKNNPIATDPETGLKIYDDSDDWEEAHLPTRVEYQIFLGILALAAKGGGVPRIRLDSWRSLLLHLGLEPTNRNFQLLKRTLQTFFNLVISFRESFLENEAINTGRYHANWHHRQFLVLSGFGNIKDSYGRVSGIHIDIGVEFFLECELHKFVQRVDVTRIMQFKSSQALSLYLYMLRWCEKIREKGNQIVYMRAQPEKLDFLYDYLGWRRPERYLEDGSINQHSQPCQVKHLIKKAIAEIMEIDKRFDFCLDEEMFEDGKVQFIFPNQDFILR